MRVEGCASSAEAFLPGGACGSSSFQKLWLAALFEALSRKQIPKSNRKTFAEAAVGGGSKTDCKLYFRKVAKGLRARGSSSHEIL